jgi:hypothetical protein
MIVRIEALRGLGVGVGWGGGGGLSAFCLSFLSVSLCVLFALRVNMFENEIQHIAEYQ